MQAPAKGKGSSIQWPWTERTEAMTRVFSTVKLKSQAPSDFHKNVDDVTEVKESRRKLDKFISEDMLKKNKSVDPCMYKFFLAQ